MTTPLRVGQKILSRCNSGMIYGRILEIENDLRCLVSNELTQEESSVRSTDLVPLPEDITDEQLTTLWSVLYGSEEM